MEECWSPGQSQPCPCLSTEPFGPGYNLWVGSLTQLRLVQQSQDLILAMTCGLTCVIITMLPCSLTSWLELVTTSGSVLLGCCQDGPWLNPEHCKVWGQTLLGGKTSVWAPRVIISLTVPAQGFPTLPRTLSQHPGAVSPCPSNAAAGLVSNSPPALPRHGSHWAGSACGFLSHPQASAWWLGLPQCPPVALFLAAMVRQAMPAPGETLTQAEHPYVRSLAPIQKLEGWRSGPPHVVKGDFFIAQISITDDCQDRNNGCLDRQYICIILIYLF